MTFNINSSTKERKETRDEKLIWIPDPVERYFSTWEQKKFIQGSNKITKQISYMFSSVGMMPGLMDENNQYNSARLYVKAYGMDGLPYVFG